MAKFRFALDSLLRARRQAERERQRAVAAIEQDRMKLEESLRDQQFHIAASKESLQPQLLGRIDVDRLRLHAASTMQAMRRAQRLVLELAGVHRRLDAARTELIEAARQRRAIEILRERRFEEWQREQEKAETAILDELSASAAARSKHPSDQIHMNDAGQPK